MTGANAGIGREACESLASLGAEVIMSARNQEAGELARDHIVATTGNKKVHLLIADLSKPEEVVKLSESVAARCTKLDVLINNAGIFLSEYTENHIAIETQWMVNHLAPYILTRRLFDLLKSTAESRIINVSSNAHLNGTINFADLNGLENYKGLKAYSQSKLANVLFTKALASGLAGTVVTSYAMHPGVVRTEIGNKNNKSWIAWIWKLGKPFMISAKKGAETIVYLASTPQISAKNGSYFINKQPRNSSSLSQDHDLAAKLWTVSEEQVADYL